MIRLLFSFCLLLSGTIQAETICTLIYDVGAKKLILEEGNCDLPVSPASTFKIPLSLMGYDSSYLTDLKLPKLPFREDYLATIPTHMQETSPTYWMKSSVVWYSQRMTEWLGIERLKHYVNAFEYGNRDLSGDPGKNNGLTRAWLSSSLKITPRQQLGFLRRLLAKQLPVTRQALQFTEQLLKQDIQANSYEIYGKTGTGIPKDKNGTALEDRQFGWFVGWAQKQGRKYVFVHNIDENKQEGVFAGAKAKAEVIARLETVLPGKPAGSDRVK